MTSFMRFLRNAAVFDNKKISTELKTFENNSSTSLLSHKSTSFDQVNSHEQKKTIKSLETNEDVELEDDMVMIKRSSKKNWKLKRESKIKNAEKELARKIQADGKLRNHNRIKLEGTDLPSPLSSFEEMKLQPYLARNIISLGYKTPTPIQMQAIPILMNRRELFGCAPTGSGKTAAYIIPILSILETPLKSSIRALVLAPTRELAAQIARYFKLFGAGHDWRILLLNKSTSAPSTLSSRHDIIVSTPMILVNSLKSDHPPDLSQVQFLILDEADRLFTEQFVNQVDDILSACSNKNLVRSLLSATLPPVVEDLARTILQNPIRLQVGHINSAQSDVAQKLLFVGKEDAKILALRQLILSGITPPILIFVQSKERAQDLLKELNIQLRSDTISIGAIHSDLSQGKRNKLIDNFRMGNLKILIATDLMARGMDFKGVKCVINFDFPQSTISYIHRIGRTGRAGRPGEAITFFTEDDSKMLRSIANVMRISGCEVPEWMLSLKKMNRNEQKQLHKRPPKRKAISKDPRRFKSKRRKILKKSKKLDK